MKKLLLSIALLSGVAMSYGQNPLPVGKVQLNAGLGFSDYGVPVYLGLDFGVGRDVTLGGEFSLRSYNDNYNGNNYNHGILGISGNGNYHFNNALDMSPEWDFYAGLNVGYYTWTSTSDYPGTRSSGLGLGAQIGGRYNFSQKVAFNLELGGGNAFRGGKIGLTFKL